MTNSKALFSKFLDALTAKNIDAAAAMLTEDFEFTGPIVQARGRADFVQKMMPLLPIVSGYRMVSQVAEGSQLCSLYEFLIQTPKGNGAILMSEWVEFRGNQLCKSRLIFNTPEVTSLLS